MEPEGSLPHLQVPATCLYPEPARSSQYPHIPLPEEPSYSFSDSFINTIERCGAEIGLVFSVVYAQVLNQDTVYIYGSGEQNSALLPLQCAPWSDFRNTKRKIYDIRRIICCY